MSGMTSPGGTPDPAIVELVRSFTGSPLPPLPMAGILLGTCGSTASKLFVSLGSTPRAKWRMRSLIVGGNAVAVSADEAPRIDQRPQELGRPFRFGRSKDAT